jgi:hypothetical protein
MVMKRTQMSWAVAWAGAIFLAGCGGGDSGLTEPVERLAVANYANVASVATDAVVGGASFSATLAGPAAAAPQAPQALLGAGDVRGWVRLVTVRAGLSGSGKAKAAAVSTETRACAVSGSLTLTVDDADNSNSLSSGDRLSTRFSACVLEAGQAPANGGFDLDIRSVDVAGEPSAFTITFRGFSSDGTTLDGSASVSVAGSIETLVFDQVSARANGQTVVYNHTLSTDGFSGLVRASGAITFKGSRYTLSTPVPVQLGANNPTAGTLVITEDSGARVEVAMSPTGYTANLFLPGDAFSDAFTVVPWSAR